MNYQEEAQKVLDSLEPENVEGYMVAFGNAFTGIQCTGIFETFEEARAYVADRPLGDWKIVAIWNASEGARW